MFTCPTVMMNVFSLPRIFLFAAITAGLAGCSNPPPNDASSSQPGGAASAATAFAPPSDLKAVLVPGPHVELSWKNHATESGGSWIEFTTPGDDFLMLAATWPDITSFVHPDLAPGTKFMYRIRPFFGRATEPLEVDTQGAIEIRPPARLKEDFLGEPHPDTEGPLVDLPAGSELASNPNPGKSVRSLDTIAAAAPTRLTAMFVSTNSVDLRWLDNASDEDGYLLEISENGKDFQVCALLPVDCTSFRKTRLPAKSWLRVRAFFNGQPSNVASATTPNEVPSRTELKTPAGQ